MSNWRTRQQSFNFKTSKNKNPPQVWQESLKSHFSYPAYFKDKITFLCPYADKSKRRAAKALTAKTRLTNKNSPEVQPENVYERVIIYPLDRSRQTPLTIWTPTDLMRNTLGLDPCAYILDLEGLKPRNSGGNRKLLAGNSCALWASHISPIAKRIKQLKPAETLDEQTKTHLTHALEDVWVFIHLVAERIREYKS